MVYFSIYTPRCVYNMTCGIQHRNKSWSSLSFYCKSFERESNGRNQQESFKDNLAVFQASESNETESNESRWRNFEVNFINDVFAYNWYCKTIHLVPKWRPINYSFVCMLTSPLRLIFTSKFSCFFLYMLTRRGGLINIININNWLVRGLSCVRIELHMHLAVW